MVLVVVAVTVPAIPPAKVVVVTGGAFTDTTRIFVTRTRFTQRLWLLNMRLKSLWIKLAIAACENCRPSIRDLFLLAPVKVFAIGVTVAGYATPVVAVVVVNTVLVTVLIPGREAVTTTVGVVV